MSLRLRVLTPDEVIAKAYIKYIDVETLDGEIRIMPEHENYLARLNLGHIYFEDEDGNYQKIFARSAIVEVNDGEYVNILADIAVIGSKEEDLIEKLDKKFEEKKQKQYDSKTNYTQAEQEIKKQLKSIKAGQLR